MWSRVLARVAISCSHSKLNRCAFVDFRLGPDPAAVTKNDTLRDSEADAVTFELIAAVETLKDAEKLVGILHVEAGTVVTDEVDKNASVLCVPYADNCRILLSGIFQSIRE